MQNLGVCACVLAVLPLSVSAQDGEEGPSAQPGVEQPARATQPEESRVKRWHPEAFTDPSKPPSEPALKLEVDSSALEVTPAAPPTLEELEEQKRRRRKIGIGVGVSLAIVAFAAVVGTVAVAKSIERGFSKSNAPDSCCFGAFEVQP